MSEPGKHWHWRRLVPVGLGLLLVLGLWGLLGSGSDRVVRLGDGREIRITGVTFGVRHRYVEGKPWLKPLAWVLPEAWLKKIGLTVVTHQSDTPSLMVWGRWRFAGTTNPPADWASVFDERGYEVDPVRRQVMVFAVPTEPVMGWEFSNFPRRGKGVGVGIYSRDNSQVARRLASFQLANPARESYPTWTADPVPVTRTNRGVAFELVRSETRREPPDRARAFWGVVAPWTVVTFKVEQEGRADRSWRVQGMEIADATGNHSWLEATSMSRMPDPLEFALNTVLWPSESAVRLGVEFSKVKDFAPDELWRSGSVSIPALGARTTINKQAVVEGVPLVLQSLARVTPLGPGGFGAIRRDLELNAELVSAGKGTHLVLTEVVDDQGRFLRHEQFSRDEKGHYRFVVELGPRSRAMELAFAVHKSRFVEFLVQPPPVSF